MKDLLPGDIAVWQAIEAAARNIAEGFGFAEIRPPLVETADLFHRSIGDATDIVQKQMYLFEDRDGEALALRPEGTASVVRAFIEHHAAFAQPVTRLYYIGPMFRHERPQAGRHRQFHQFGTEALGAADPLVDVELLALLDQFWARLGLTNLTLELNSVGCQVCRPAYRTQLTAFLTGRRGDLCENCRRRIEPNPLRVLDCKQDGCRAATAKAPLPADHLCTDCHAHFEAVRDGLTRVGLAFQLNGRLVRGLDYYTKTAFEVTSQRLGAQNAVAAGGRYDGLVEALGGAPTPGIGFAVGLERLALLFDRTRLVSRAPRLFLAALGPKAKAVVLPVVIALRRHGLPVETDYHAKSLKAQLRQADRLGVEAVVIVGDDEVARGRAVYRDMAAKQQDEIPLTSLTDDLLKRLRER